MEIRKGQRSPLAQILQNTNPIFQIELSISGVDVDFSCFGLNANDKLFSDEYMVFFNQPQTPCDAVLFTTEMCSAIFSCDLSKLPVTIEKLSFTAAIDGQETMQQIQSGHLKFLVDGQEVACFHFDGSDFNSEKALMLGDIYRKNGDWRFGAVEQGFNGGLESLVKHFGGAINNDDAPILLIEPIEAIETSESIEFENLATSQYALFAEEIKRLCQVEKQLFQEMLQLPHVFESTTAEKSQSKTYFEDGIKNIENEIQKLEKMEVVIAVVGTMKAGKSTTINAIVGTEVLPNRNAPMTTLPTLIRNVHGQTEPVLKLEKLQPLEDLSKQIATKLAVLIKSNEIGKVALYVADDGKNLIDNLLKNKGYQFKKEYKGQQAICSFLKHLNDLMRLAKENSIDIEPPYHEYENINDLPVIEIEFFHLKGQENSAQGSLAILDTPGPDEAGQSEALRKIFRTQLNKASAVSLVIDYTKINSESDATVRNAVSAAIKQLPKENLYLLVNKFDQANTGSMQEKEVKEVIYNSMNGEVQLSQIYPISAQNAYLANRARNTLSIHDKLPNFEQESWVKDFAQNAMGEMWEEDIDNIERVKKCADRFWIKSLFQEPLEGMVEKAHSTAAENCVKSAIPKLVHFHQELTNSCSIINTSLSTEINKINDAIRTLENSINDVETVKKNVDDIIKNGIVSLEGVLNGVQNTTQDRIKKEIDSFFTRGKGYEKETYLKNPKEQKNKENEVEKLEKELAQLKSQMFHLLDKDVAGERKRRMIELEYQLIKAKEAIELERRYKFDSSSSIISFKASEKDKAEALLKEIEKEITDILNKWTNSFTEEVNKITSNMSDEIASEINLKTITLLKKAKEKLGEFQLDFSLPELKLSFELDTSNLIFKGLTKKSESFYYDEVRGALNMFLNFFWDNWGKTKVTGKKITYDIDTNKMREMIINELVQYENNYTQKFTNYLEQDVKKNVGSHINELSNYLERYRDLFLSSEKANAEMEKEEKKQVIQQIGLVITKNNIQSNDIKVIENGLGV